MNLLRGAKSLKTAVKKGLVSPEELTAAMRTLRNGGEQGGQIISFAHWRAERCAIIEQHNKAICALEEVEIACNEFLTILED